MKILKGMNITFKNTFPIYLMISVLTFLFLMLGSYLNSFSIFGAHLLAKMWFASTYNLLYFIPQSVAVLIALFFLKVKDPAWFFRIGPSACLIITFIMILIFRRISFFPANIDLKNLYINLLIIMVMNIVFTVIVSLNIYSKMKILFKIRNPNKNG